MRSPFLPPKMCSDTSPRLSFSNDLINQEEETQIQEESRRDSKLLESSCDFEFRICSSSSEEDDESFLADRLFSNGMILPVQLLQQKPKKIPPKESNPLPPLPFPSISHHENSNKETLMTVSSDSEEKTQSKSFWGFKRSTSLNCDIKKSLICSLPLLSRSNSTGSAPNPAKRTSFKDVQQKLQQKSLSKSSASAHYVYPLPQKPPLRKNYSGSNGSGVRFSPVLNVPPPYITKATANLFGLGSLLRNGKEKRSKK